MATPETGTDLRPGLEIASVKLLEPLGRGERIVSWRGRWPDGSAGTIHALHPGANKREVENFLAGARRLQSAMRGRPPAGIVPIAAVVPTRAAYVTHLSSTGTMEDVPVLEWRIRETLQFYRKLCSAFAALHQTGMVHGCARPGNVLLDDDLSPVLTDVGMLRIDDSYEASSETKHDYAAYAAREIRIGHDATVRSDVFTLGRLLHFTLAGGEPNEPDDALALLGSLEHAPQGLVRIIRRATARDPMQRYPSVESLLQDLDRHDTIDAVGIGHPLELSGLTDDGEGARPSWTPRAPTPGLRATLASSDTVIIDERPSTRPPPPPDSRPRMGSRPAFGAPEPRPRQASRSNEDPRGAPLPLRPRPKARPRADSLLGDGDDLLSPTAARVAAAVGAVLVVASVVYAYLEGASSTPVLVATVVGSVCLSLGVPSIGTPVISRGVAALVFGVAAWLINPATMAAERGRKAHFTAGSAAERGARIRESRKAGNTDFTGLDLPGTDFHDGELNGARFDDSNLDGSTFEGARLHGASFTDARVGGVSFVAADLSGARIDAAIGWRDTRCDTATIMPAQWLCQNGRPAPVTEVRDVPSATP
jgi:serine/threonine-protein kinase